MLLSLLLPRNIWTLSPPCLEFCPGWTILVLVLFHYTFLFLFCPACLVILDMSRTRSVALVATIQSRFLVRKGKKKNFSEVLLVKYAQRLKNTSVKQKWRLWTLFIWTYLHKYGHYDQSVRAFSSFCIICVQLMIVVDQLHLEHTKITLELLEEFDNINDTHYWHCEHQPWTGSYQGKQK